MPARVLVAGVGHRMWRDRSAGMYWMEQLRAEAWPAHVVIDDFGFGAIAMMQRLEDERYERAIFLAAETRERPPGTLHVRRHAPQHPPPELVHAQMHEAGGGVITIDTLLIIIEHFGVLPRETWIVEAEPADTGWGEGTSDQIAALYPDVCARITDLIAQGDVADVARAAGAPP